MDLADVVARRRMVRRFDPAAQVPPEAVDRLLDAARRSPSAGFTQGVSFLVLDRPEDRHRFWGEEGPRESGWLEGMRTAPVLVLIWTSEQAYLDRYAEPDKGWSDRDPSRWSAPYWWVDAGMAAMVLLYGAVDAGLGACFFGVPARRQEEVRAAFGVPADQLSVGAVGLGVPAPDERPSGSPRRRGRTPAERVIHRGQWY